MFTCARTSCTFIHVNQPKEMEMNREETREYINEQINACYGWPCGICSRESTCRKARYVDGKSCAVYDCAKWAADMYYCATKDD